MAAKSSGETVRVLHSPSNPIAKGSERIRTAVDTLRGRGVRVELVTIEGRANADVLAELSRCDLVVDQLYSDYAMPGFATEASWYGKPVLICGYAQPMWKEWLPEEATPPTVFCHPDRFEAELERLVRDPAARAAAGRAGRRFAELQWSPRAVAARYLQIIRGDVPDSWWLDPRDNRYLHGVGMPEPAVKRIVRELIERHGTEALQLEDKPALARAFESWSRSETESGRPT